MNRLFLLTALCVALPFISGCEDQLVGPSAAGATFGAPASAPSLAESEHGSRQLTATLTGAAEVPGPGDPDGTGSAVVRLDPGEGEVCFQLAVQDIAPATAAHIHEGTADVAGPVVVTLTPPTDGTSRGCISGVDPDLIKDIRKNPADYYVNVHNADFLGGAVRDQLSR